MKLSAYRFTVDAVATGYIHGAVYFGDAFIQGNKEMALLNDIKKAEVQWAKGKQVKSPDADGYARLHGGNPFLVLGNTWRDEFGEDRSDVDIVYSGIACLNAVLPPVRRDKDHAESDTWISENVAWGLTPDGHALKQLIRLYDAWYQKRLTAHWFTACVRVANTVARPRIPASFVTLCQGKTPAEFATELDQALRSLQPWQRRPFFIFAVQARRMRNDKVSHAEFPPEACNERRSTCYRALDAVSAGGGDVLDPVSPAAFIGPLYDLIESWATDMRAHIHARTGRAALVIEVVTNYDMRRLKDLALRDAGYATTKNLAADFYATHDADYTPHRALPGKRFMRPYLFCRVDDTALVSPGIKLMLNPLERDQYGVGYRLRPPDRAEEDEEEEPSSGKRPRSYLGNDAETRPLFNFLYLYNEDEEEEEEEDIIIPAAKQTKIFGWLKDRDAF